MIFEYCTKFADRNNRGNNRGSITIEHEEYVLFTPNVTVLTRCITRSMCVSLTPHISLELHSVAHRLKVVRFER